MSGITASVGVVTAIGTAYFGFPTEATGEVSVRLVCPAHKL